MSSTLVLLNVDDERLQNEINIFKCKRLGDLGILTFEKLLNLNKTAEKEYYERNERKTK